MSVLLTRAAFPCRIHSVKLAIRRWTNWDKRCWHLGPLVLALGTFISAKAQGFEWSATPWVPLLLLGATAIANLDVHLVLSGRANKRVGRVLSLVLAYGVLAAFFTVFCYSTFVARPQAFQVGNVEDLQRLQQMALVIDEGEDLIPPMDAQVARLRYKVSSLRSQKVNLDKLNPERFQVLEDLANQLEEVVNGYDTALRRLQARFDSFARVNHEAGNPSSELADTLDRLTGLYSVLESDVEKPLETTVVVEVGFMELTWGTYTDENLALLPPVAGATRLKELERKRLTVMRALVFYPDHLFSLHEEANDWLRRARREAYSQRAEASTFTAFLPLSLIPYKVLWEQNSIRPANTALWLLLLAYTALLIPLSVLIPVAIVKTLWPKES